MWRTIIARQAPARRADRGRQRRVPRPPAGGGAEVGYGIEEASRGQGIASEATRACVEWAFAHPDIVAVQATTFPWHVASLGVIRNLGMQQISTREHDTLGELLVFERRR